MKRIVLLFLFFSCLLNAQRVEFKGKLVDRDTEKPVVYANLSFLDNQKGISTTENGTFLMYIDQKDLNSSIHISCLNYKDTIVLAKTLLNATLKLAPKTEVLDEVVVSKVLDKKVILDPVKKKVLRMHSRGLRMIAKYFPNTEKNACCKFIEKVKITFPKRKNVQSKFRFRIFTRDQETGLPKDDLLTENLPLTIQEGDTEIELDLSNYYIEMPENGFFIAFEKLFIPFNEYGYNAKDPNSEVFYSPIVGIVKSKEHRKMNRNYIFVKGKWIELVNTSKGRLRGYVPAISVTLSN